MRTQFLVLVASFFLLSAPNSFADVTTDAHPDLNDTVELCHSWVRHMLSVDPQIGIGELFSLQEQNILSSLEDRQHYDVFPLILNTTSCYKTKGMAAGALAYSFILDVGVALQWDLAQGKASQLIRAHLVTGNFLRREAVTYGSLFPKWYVSGRITDVSDFLSTLKSNVDFSELASSDKLEYNISSPNGVSGSGTDRDVALHRTAALLGHALNDREARLALKFRECWRGESRVILSCVDKFAHRGVIMDFLAGEDYQRWSRTFGVAGATMRKDETVIFYASPDVDDVIGFLSIGKSDADIALNIININSLALDLIAKSNSH